MLPVIAHLADAASSDGVDRILRHVTNSTRLAQNARHRVVRPDRGRLAAAGLSADVIVSHVPITWGSLPRLTNLRATYSRKPILHVEHSLSERFVALNVPNRDRFGALLRVAYALFDRIVAVSEAQAGWLLRRRLCPPARLSIVEPCAALAPLLTIPERRGDGRRIIGAIGSFDARSGFDMLIDAFRSVARSDMALHLHGDGPDSAALRKRAGGQANIVFKGSANDVAEAMAACDLIAMPSRWEPYGLIALEAMAAGKPVLCPRVDGLAGHIRAGAVEVGENTAGGWTAMLAQLDGAAIARASERGREHAKSAELRFAAAWTSLIERATSAYSDTAVSA